VSTFPLPEKALEKKAQFMRNRWPTLASTTSKRRTPQYQTNGIPSNKAQPMANTSVVSEKKFLSTTKF